MKESESISHLFITCSFSTAVWSDCLSQVGLNHRWDGDTVNSAWDRWWRSFSRSKLKALPLIIIWGIWLARNGAIFENKACLPAITSAQSVGLYKALPEHIRAAEQRRNLNLVLDKSYPWGFFDGAAQDDLCGGGAYLYLSDSHFFSLTMGLGAGTNNYAELMSLKLLLIFATEKGINRLTVLGDSMNAINWIKQTQACRNVRLANLLSVIQTVIQSFDIFAC